MENDLSRKIKELRLAKKMTLEEVATIVGVGKSTVRKWETGMIANMKRDKIALLAKALSTTPAYLMGWKEEKTDTNLIEATETEQKLLALFRQIHPAAQEVYIEMLEVRLKNQSKE